MEFKIGTPSRISNHAITEIFDQCKRVKSLDYIKRGLVEVTSNDSEKYVLHIKIGRAHV